MPSFYSILRRFRQERTPSCGAVIVAAGRSERMNGVDKIMAPIGGCPIIARTIAAFEQCPLICEIVVVTRPDLVLPIGDLCRSNGYSKVKKIVEGGADRTRSVLNGAEEVSSAMSLTAIHDGARPFVSRDVIERVILAAAKSAAAAPAIPVSDTVKYAEKGVVTDTPDRSKLFAVQTPQVFDSDLIRAALRDCVKKGITLTDDCAAVERIGKQVQLTKGDGQNIKITTRLDLKFGEEILKMRGSVRIGQGYDVHRLTPDRKLILGGVEIPFESGLSGHSDADVIIHAIMDALLGAAGLWDIGHVFPDDDPNTEGISSLVLLERVRDMLGKGGWSVVNIDGTILAQRPKLAPYIPEMRRRIAACLEISDAQVNLKATTEEGMGFTGAEQGIAAQAVALLEQTGMKQDVPESV